MSPGPDPVLAREAVNTIKFLAVDAVEKARSGHPGMPMGAADVAFVLWSRFLRHDPTAPDWFDRDRFVLSAGHGSMLLYALLHLHGYDLPLSEIQAFRQWGSRTPGHPEFGQTPGVESTTGPLGQGIGNGVGMALAARMLAARLGKGDFLPVTHRVFVLASDGDVMEGVSGEASSLAGHLRLGNLVVLYDDNRITIEGSTDLTFSEDVGRRYESYGWLVEHVDGHDHEDIARGLEAAVSQPERPSFIVCRTHIAHGAPTKQDTAASHGAPLGPEETRAAKVAAGWPLDPPFLVPDRVRAYFRALASEGAALRTAWETRFQEWRARNPDRAATWDAIVGRKIPGDLTERLMESAPTGAAATREHGSAVMQTAASLVPALVGGSADLGTSNLTILKGERSVAPSDWSGRNLHFGIREHGMGAILNGIAYYGAFRPYGSTFLIFSDYMKPAIRVAALARLPVIYVFTHDSIFVGEDGPTHEPIEQPASLRLVPNLRVFRPADGLETAAAWGLALERTGGPTALLLTRHKVPALDRSAARPLADLRRGAYVVADASGPEAVVVAAGSEVHLALGAREALSPRRRLRVVSAPCLELFFEQDAAYRNDVLPPGVPVATIEAGRTDLWRSLAGPEGLTIGIDRFGASAPMQVLAERFGFTRESVTERIDRWLEGLPASR